MIGKKILFLTPLLFLMINTFSSDLPEKKDASNSALSNALVVRTVIIKKQSATSSKHYKDHEDIPQHDFIYDAYTDKRGIPKMLNIYCDECGAWVMQYQKDGPGRLLRCYLDRIHRPSVLKQQQYEEFDVETSPKLRCPNSRCRLVIGMPMIYRSETRPAYKLKKNCFYFKEDRL